jgi:hypothetical protein
VVADQVRVVHAVQVVAAEDQKLVGAVVGGVVQGGAHRVGGALEPVLPVGGLLGGQDVDEAVGEGVEGVGLHDVPVEAGRHELGQHEHPLDVGVDAVGDRDVDDAVLAREAHRRLGPLQRQREQPGSPAPAEDDCGDVLHVVSSSRKFTPTLHERRGQLHQMS